MSGSSFSLLSSLWLRFHYSTGLSDASALLKREVDEIKVARAQEHMSVDTVEGSSVLQTRDEPTSVDAGNSEFFRATEASSSNVISSSPSACHDRARPLSESFYSCSQSSKEHNGECSADVPMTPTGEETAEATSESAEGVAGFFTKDQAAKILLQIAVGMSQVDNYTTHRDLKASNVLIDKHRQHGGRYKPRRYSYE